MEQKTDYPGIYKVGEGVFVNKDNEALAGYKKMKQRNKEIQNLKNDVADIKSDLADIKNLLKELVK